MPGSIALNERLALPAAPGAVVVRSKPAPRVLVVNPNVPAPSVVTFSITIEPVWRWLTNVQVTVSPAASEIADGGLPSLQVAEVRFQRAGTLSAAS